jgi:acyl carrier protein
MQYFSRDEVRLKVKDLIIRTLNFKNTRPEDILDNVSLFSGENNIKIDSVDSLELVMEIQREFKVKINTQNLAWTIINTVDNITEFIIKEQIKEEV